MKKFIAFLFVFMVLGAGTARAQLTDFRPGIAEVPEYKFSLSIPLIPELGLMNLRGIGSIYSYFDILTKLNLPNEYQDMGMYANEAINLMNTVNKLHKKNIMLKGFVLPSRILSINTKFFELTVDGGIQNHISVNVKGLKEKVSLANISMEQVNGWYYTKLNVGGHKLLNVASTTWLGGDVWGIGKAPIKLENGDTLTLLAGVGVTLAYAHVFNYEINTEDAEDITAVLSDKTTTKTGLVWAIHGMVGAQYDGFKYLRPRVVLQFCGRPGSPGELPELSPEYNLGVDLEIWKIATLRAEVLDMQDPEYRVELSRGFGINSEVAVGGIFRSEIYGKALAYFVLGLGGKPVKVTTTVLTDGKQVGLMFGVAVGYMP